MAKKLTNPHDYEATNHSLKEGKMRPQNESLKILQCNQLKVRSATKLAILAFHMHPIKPRPRLLGVYK